MAEAERRRIVGLVFAGFWLLVFEGSIRKWLAPQYSAYLYFLRDPLTLYIYIVALRAGVFRDQSLLLGTGMAMAVIAMLLSLVHIMSGGGQYTAVLAAYGLRNYFAYIPLAFVIGRCFTAEDVRRLGVQALVAMMIAAPLAVLQFNAPSGSALNVGISSNSALQFDNLVSGSGKVRPAGTFTSVVGMTQLTVVCVAFLMWCWTRPGRPRPIDMRLALVAFVATAAALAVSGSRTSFVHSCLVIAAGVGIAPFLPGTGAKLRSFVIPAVVVAVFATLFPILMPEAFSTFMSRWTDAAATEGERFALGWVGRALHGFYDFLRLMGDTPLLGHGVGMAGNGASSAGVTLQGVNVLRIAEEDWSRHVVELGPVLAPLFIAYRILFGIWLGRSAWRATRLSGDPLPVLLFTYAAVSLVQGQITGHGLVNGFGWLFVGVCMAASANAMAPATSRQPARAAGQPLASLPSFPNLMR